jgi:type IV pilus assembly protein PilF
MMAMRTVSIVALVALALTLGGCVGGGTSQPRTSSEQAARLNTDLGLGYYQQGRLDIALERLERAVSQDPRFAPAHSSLALVYEALEQTADAERHFRTALRLSERDAGLLNTYAVFLCRQGRHGEAEDYFRRAADDRLYRTPEVALTNAGVCLSEVPDLERAEQYLREALQHNPQFPDALLQMASVSHERENHMAARAFLERYLNAGAATAQALLLGVRVERALGDEQAAGDYAQRLRRDFPDSAEARSVGGS